MKYSYDPEVDIALIKISQAKPDYGEQQDNVITHYDKQGKVVEIEILGASRSLFKIAKSIVAHASKTSL